MKDNPEDPTARINRDLDRLRALRDNTPVPSETFTTSLSRIDVEQLALVPYDRPGGLPTRRSARLLKLGLIEQNPTAPGEVRCTQQGTDVVLRFRQQGWIR